MEKRQELYHGKAKTVYTTDDPNVLVMHYRDDVSAFDGAKLAKLERKGETNNKFNAFIMGKLAAAGVPTHFVRLLRLPDAVKQRYDVSSIVFVASTGSPCPPDVKKQMIDWWGPVINESYASSEAGFGASCASPPSMTQTPGARRPASR